MPNIDRNAERYRELIDARRGCTICDGVVNCSKYPNDPDAIGPWSLWQGNLDADVMIVGQDWGDVSYFEKAGPNEPPGNPTNRHLMELLSLLGYELSEPGDPAGRHHVFLTNAVLCLKEGKGLQAKVERGWFENCGVRFLRPLIEIVVPRVVVALGEKAFHAILLTYGLKKQPLRQRIGNPDPIELSERTVLFPVYHCGARVTNTTRSRQQQQADWTRIAKWLDGCNARRD